MWKDIKKLDSTDKNVSKYVFTKDDAVAESVLYKYPTYEERTVICCSTQSGCPIGCRFCGAGDNFVRSLTTEEIISQPIRLIQDTAVNPKDIQRLQIMFMSMGEPMLNLKNLIPALRHLNRVYSHAALLISTSGPLVAYDEFTKVSQEIPTIGLQFSIHESTNEKRDKLIPFKNKLTLEEIAIVGSYWFKQTGRTPFFNYCVHEENGTDEDVERLLVLFNPNIWQATISVICERDEHIAAANARQRTLAENFRDKLSHKGYRTRVFNPAGQDDIGGGCGQLWFVQQWMKDNEHLTLKSIGHNMPVVHTPKEIL